MKEFVGLREKKHMYEWLTNDGSEKKRLRK